MGPLPSPEIFSSELTRKTSKFLHSVQVKMSYSIVLNKILRLNTKRNQLISTFSVLFIPKLRLSRSFFRFYNANLNLLVQHLLPRS